MTICVGIQVNDCLVFAADSAVTLFYGQDDNGSDVINVLPHGNKVFNLHRDLPICAMTCGLGNIGASSISHLSKDLRLALMSGSEEYVIDPDNYTIEEVASKARKFFFEERFLALVEKPKTDLTFYVGGYSSKAESPETWMVTIQSEAASSPAPQCQVPMGICSAVWGGQPEAISRLILGVSLQHTAALAGAGFDAGQVAAISSVLSSNMQAKVLHAAMPVQDAVDLADFLVETTKRYVRFLPGADTVGGDTDIAVVTKHEGFKWVRRKHYFRQPLNPAEVSYGARYPAEKGKPGQIGSDGDPHA